MAGIRKKGDAYYCTFRFQGQRYYFAIGTVTEAAATAKGAEVDETLNLLERGRLTLPEGVPLADFVAAGGKAPLVSARPDVMTTRQLFDHYSATQANGTVENNSLQTIRIHLNQMAESLGERFRIQGLTLLNLQAHVDRRGKKGIATATIKKEIATTRACWAWAVQAGLLKGACPSKGLRFPKDTEKEPFRTFAEIEAVIAAERPESGGAAILWEALYLTRAEMEELLAHVQQAGGQPWLYPMVAFAAYTGARRSELLRAALTDIDLKAGTATIREKKRTKGKLSSRKVPLTPKLVEILRAWVAVRPASSFLFCQPQRVVHSKKRRTEPTGVTKDEAHDHLRRALAGSKWKVLRGYHVLRHSFCSNLVAGGVDQRIIDEIVGHSTEEQRRRYRHLAPKATHDAVKSVYG